MYSSQSHEDTEAPLNGMENGAQKGSKGLDREGEGIVRNILVAYETDEKREALRYAIALFDTGCPDNLISRRVAAMLGFQCETQDTRDIDLVSVTGERYLSLGVLKGRWAFSNNISEVGNPHIRKTSKYMNAIFHVSSNENDPFDVIIGFNTIKDQRLLLLGEKLLAGFRRVQKAIDVKYSTKSREWGPGRR
ncbi:uncharacterized protein BDR25DRAFT_340116 [Lindgomyces ingoldianus]|uniref:Uncharacterized protein n=1 Tax=Lindgomyces ingoldianus TaxID=673940 RepID=A0ACB6R7L8_9PLEO|nr:uncharacterized protein BDR25DRAFT_340116 [Lindgomyces ingoldianus]KAF2475308.1 hypothetical protein BDR25DRAFT_340116 [Lindgomyces ingoldianus]